MHTKSKDDAAGARDVQTGAGLTKQIIAEAAPPGKHLDKDQVARDFNVMIALGTHQPMSEAAICERLEISSDERGSTYKGVRFLNHEWNNPQALRNIGTIAAADISALTNGLFSIDVPVEINRRVFDYDQIIIVGPVFPHEVVGFSGGSADPEFLPLARRGGDEPDDHRQ